MNTTILPERLARLDTITLDVGSHEMGGRKPGGQPTAAQSFWARVNQSGDCWLWTGRTDDKGYGRVGYHKRDVGAHRVSWALTHGDRLPELPVLHHCDNPPCVNPAHLFLGTLADNNRDRQAKGRTRGCIGRSGPDHHAHFVTPEMAAAMRQMRAERATQQQISERFQVSRSYVSVLVSGVLPRHARGARS